MQSASDVLAALDGLDLTATAESSVEEAQPDSLAGRRAVGRRAADPPGDGPSLVSPRSNRYHAPNTIGNLVERAVTFASFVFGGVMDRHPDLRICLCHGGGYTCFGIGRMDRGWQVRPEAREKSSQPPSAYLN